MSHPGWKLEAREFDHDDVLRIAFDQFGARGCGERRSRTSRVTRAPARQSLTMRRSKEARFLWLRAAMRATIWRASKTLGSGLAGGPPRFRN